MKGIDFWTQVSIASSLVSLVIGILAILLSVAFFFMSHRQAANADDSAKSIANSVDRLEQLFNLLYRDTFGMMKDAYSKISEHAWPESKNDTTIIEERTAKKVEDKLAILKAELTAKIEGLLASLDAETNEKVDSVRRQLEEAASQAVDRTRQVEVETREETLHDAARRMMFNLRKRIRRTTASDLVNMLQERANAPFFDAVEELIKMKEEGLLDWTDEVLRPATMVILRKQNLNNLLDQQTVLFDEFDIGVRKNQ